MTSHVSYSELINWNKCPFYHKLVNVDKLKLFKGNEYTAFGQAIHSTCETLVNEAKVEDKKALFNKYFAECTGRLPDLNENLLKDMKGQGESLVDHILPSLEEYFGKFEVISTEELLMEPIHEYEQEKFNFKGYIDLVLKTSDGKYHVIDWKSCSWGWDRRKKSEKTIVYQLSFYKHFWSKKHNVDSENVKTYFGLLKRTAKNNKIELFEVSNGKLRTQNAIDFMLKALHNINNKNTIKNKLACKDRWGYCEFYKTEHCN